MSPFLLDTIETGCHRPLGMISGEIRDFQISTSSQNPWIGVRLYGSEGWCAQPDDHQPFVQVSHDMLQ